MALTQPTVTGDSGFWNDILVPTGPGGGYSPTPVAQLGYRSPIERQIARLMKRNSLRDLRTAFGALIGATSGSNMTGTYSRVRAPVLPSENPPQPTFIGELAGNRTIETITVVNRNTTAADVTYLKQIVANDRELEANMATVGYPADASGIGGGGKIVAGAITF